MAERDDDIDLDQVIWDPRYRRRVIERLNREAGVGAGGPTAGEPSRGGAGADEKPAPPR